MTTFINLCLRPNLKLAQISQILDEPQNENRVIVGDMNCFDDENRKTLPQYVKQKLICNRTKETGLYHVAQELNQKANTHLARNDKPARLDYLLMNRINPPNALESIQTMYSAHRILKLSLKDIKQQDQRSFTMDDETIRPNRKAVRQMLKAAVDLNDADQINGGYVKLKTS